MLSFLGWLVFGILLLAAVPAQVIGLPGTWIIFGNALALRLLTGSQHIEWPTLIILFGLAVGGEVMEFVVSVKGTRISEPIKGAAAAAIAGAIAGGAVGTPFFFGLGAVPGMAIGAFLGVFLVGMVRGKRAVEAFGAGVGALVGRLKGTAAKVLVSIGMVIMAVVSVVAG